MNINQAVLDNFTQIKISRELCAMILDINTAAQEVRCLESFPKGTPYQAIIGQLPKDEARILIIDVEHMTDEKPPRTTNKLVLVSWAPETAPARQKFAFANAKSDVQAALTGIQKDLQATDAPDLDFDEVRKNLFKA